MSRGSGPMLDFPALTAAQTAILNARLSNEIVKRDAENTLWLKGVIEKNGWPKISEVGEDASSAAWLLVQHADADPQFQLRTLRLMEPLLNRGEVSKQNYAYLFDRTMLKLTGKQRYGTQVTCINGDRKPHPLEAPSQLDELRKGVGLQPEDVYLVEMTKRVGQCPLSTSK